MSLAVDSRLVSVRYVEKDELLVLRLGKSAVGIPEAPRVPGEGPSVDVFSIW